MRQPRIERGAHRDLHMATMDFTTKPLTPQIGLCRVDRNCYSQVGWLHPAGKKCTNAKNIHFLHLEQESILSSTWA
jgi:hypothetical protein